MKKSILKFHLIVFSMLIFSHPIFVQPPQPQIAEHIKGGQPDSDSLLVRNAYVLSYNEQYRIPNWVAYHVVPDYLNTPERKGKFKRFRTDTEVEDAVETTEYNGLFSTKGYARGHFAPYKILGGDRDGDGKYAVYNDNVNSDPDDEKTVFQGNFMTNIAPQHHSAINGPGGLWYKLERWIQDDLVKQNQKELWVFAGAVIFDAENVEGVGKNDSIAVPNLFYKIVIMDSGQNQPPHVLAFLFPHFKNKEDVKEKSIFKYLIAVDYLEAITGLDFFNKYSNQDQVKIESNIDTDAWKTCMN